MITYRTCLPTDHAAVDALLAGAFDDHGQVVVQMVHDIRAGAHHRADYDVVAVEDGRVVGHVLLSGTTIQGEGSEREVLQLTPVAVAEDLRRRGVGTALIEHVVARADAAGEPLVLLEGSRAFYGRRGFEPAAEHGIDYPLPSWAPPAAAQVRLLSGYDASDTSLRGRVVHPDYMPDQD